MRAIIIRRHGAELELYEQVDDLAEPRPAPDEVVVRVSFAALNRLDDWVRIGWKGLRLDFPHVPCSDFAGEIVALGNEVRGWEVGQRVTANPLLWCGRCPACIAGRQNHCAQGHLLGEHVSGSCADYVAVPARNLIAIPEGVALEVAAAASLVYLTAWHSLLTVGDLRAGERVLVVGAGGGVNSAAIQIALLAGAEVFAHDRSRTPDWGRALFAATGRAGVDMVVDNVGQATWPVSLRALRPGGRLVTVGGTSGYDAQVPVNLIFARHLRLLGSTMGTQTEYARVMGLVFAGRLPPIIDSVTPLAGFRSAMARMLADEHFGKILIDVRSHAGS
jgi:NADPH:quinone reductase-like Zn-dependent oxidoreductase